MGTKVRANQIFGIPKLYAPTVHSFSPTSMLPNTTKEITIIGSFFNPDTTFQIGGCTINWKRFENNDYREVTLQVSSGATEGNFDLTINNGKELVVQDLFTISNGIVTVPLAADFTKTGTINVSDGELTKVADNTTGEATWNRLIPSTEPFTIQWILTKTPYVGGTWTTLEFVKASDGSLFEGYITFQINSGRLRINYRVGGNAFYLEDYMDYGTVFGFRRTTDGKVQYVKNGVVTKSNTNNLTFDLYLRWGIETNDVKYLKYIDNTQ